MYTNTALSEPTHGWEFYSTTINQCERRYSKLAAYLFPFPLGMANKITVQDKGHKCSLQANEHAVRRYFGLRKSPAAELLVV